MSTRCHLGFYSSKEKDIRDWDALIYRHYDGYPEGVIPDIEPMLKRFNRERGLSDTSYAAAWLVHELISSYVKDSVKNAKEWGFPGMPKDGKNWLGHGICKDIHCDIEFFYKIYPSAIEIYDAVIPWKVELDAYDKAHFKLIKTIELA
jgi:hypothetical protein